eukprot:COSAG02_NODE_5542_length_4244_cov_2.738963_4_plen_82_part_00
MESSSKASPTCKEIGQQRVRTEAAQPDRTYRSMKLCHPFPECQINSAAPDPHLSELFPVAALWPPENVAAAKSPRRNQLAR